MEALFALLPFACIASFTPGPNNILVMSHSINSGIRSTMPYQAGVGVACFVIIAAVLALGAQVEKYIPSIIHIMRYVGCAYMLWLAWLVATARPEGPHRARASTLDEPCMTTRVTAARGASFVSGVILQFVNPKFYLYVLTLAAVLIPSITHMLDILGYAGVFGGLAVAGTMAWAVAGAVLQRALVRWYRVTNAVMGLLLVWCAWTVL